MAAVLLGDALSLVASAVFFLVVYLECCSTLYCGVVSNPQRQRSQPPMFLNIVLFDLIFGILGRVLIRGWVYIRINKVYLGQVNPAVFLKILLHIYETRQQS